MSGNEEEGSYSGDAAPYIIKKINSLVIGDTRKSDLRPGHVVYVALPCGHQLPQDYLKAWCRHELNQKKPEFTCPVFTCGAGFTYQVLSHKAELTHREVELFEEKLGELTAAKLCDYKPCPGCQSFVERADKKNLCVRCTICTASMGRTYEFCWNCNKEWKGPMPNTVRCDNSGCGKELIYPMKEKSCGRTRLALIINNIEFIEECLYREGAEKDEESMRILLKGLGYEVITLNNLSAEGMKAALKDFSQRKEHKSSDSTFVVMMSHGGPEGIYGIYYNEKENDVFPVETIFHCLNSQNCENLIDKPKIILIQACRGENMGSVWVADCGNPKGVQRQKVFVEKDFGCLRSCTPDTVSLRNTRHGSIFIQTLVQIFNEHAHDCDVVELFRKIAYWFEEDAKKGGCYQMPCMERTTIVKRFYLFPGI